MSLSIGILMAIALIALLVLSKRSNATTESRKTVTSAVESTTSKFHAVSIQSSNGACNAAKLLEGKRFLSSAAPHIPLADCDAGNCTCRFVHHADRRSGVDRRGRIPDNVIAAREVYGGRERRYRGDRRGSDEPQDFFA